MSNGWQTLRGTDSALNGGKLEVVFVDTSITGWQELAAGVQPDIEIVLLDGQRDGLAQIADWAAGREDYDGIHILSHGAQAQLKLGNLLLNAAGLEQRADDLAILGRALKENGDILFYGCDLAQNAEGADWLARFSTLTGADVAASTNLTGAAARGGDFVLEANIGVITTASLAITDFTGTLVTTTLNGTLTSDYSFRRPWTPFDIDFADNGQIDSTSPVTTYTAAEISQTSLDFYNYASATFRPNSTGTFTFMVSAATLTHNMQPNEIDLQWYNPAEDTFLAIYEGSFDPLTPLANLKWTNEDAREAADPSTPNDYDNKSQIADVNLTSGTDYVLVMTSSRADSTGTYTFTVDGTSAGIFTAGTPGSNAPPSVDNPGSATPVSSVEQTPIMVAGGITIIDTDGDADWEGGTLTVQITGNAQGTDRLTIPTSYSSGLWLSGTALMADGVQIGNNLFSNGSGGNAWVFTFNDKATNALVESLARTISFSAATDAPSIAARTITFTAADGEGSSGSTAQLVTVTAVNDAPTASNMTGTASYNEDAASVALTDISVIEPDGAGDTITATLTLNNASAGTLTTGTFGTVTSSYNAGTGVWRAIGTVADVNAALASVAFIPTGHWETDTTITTRIRDQSNVGPTDGTITLDVTPVNDQPTATNLTQTIGFDEDPGINIALDDIFVSDVDAGEIITATLTLSNAAAGSLTTSGGATYNAGTGIWTVSGTVAAVNTALANVAFVAAANWDQTATISTKIRDAADTGPAPGTITLNITAKNDAPTALNLTQAKSFVEDPGASVTLDDVVVTDPDTGDTITATLTLSNKNAGELTTGTFGAATSTYAAATGIWTVSGSAADVNAALADVAFSAAANWDQDFTITTRIRDAAGTGPADGTITFNVTPVNDAPSFGSPTATKNVDEGTTLVTALTAVDPENSNLIYSLDSGNDEGLFKLVLDGSGDISLYFIDPPDYEADDSYTVAVKVEDEDGAFGTQIITVNIQNVNEAPTITSPAALTIDENGKNVATIAATDPDSGTTLTYSIQGGDDAALFEIDAASGALSFKTAPDYETPSDVDVDNVYKVEVTVDDGIFSDTKLFSVTVQDGNDVPVIISNGGGNTAAVTISENSKPVTTVTATDQDAGASLTYAIIGGADAALFEINATTGALSFNAAPDFESPTDADSDGAYLVQVQATDGLATDTQILTVNVQNANEAPTLMALGTNPTYVEAGAAVTLFGASAVDTVDAGQTLASVTISVTDASSDDVLIFDGKSLALQAGPSTLAGIGNASISVSGGTATVTLSNLALSPADFEGLINSIQFKHIGDSPAASRTVTITGLSDSGTGANSTSGLPLSSTITIHGQPDVTSILLPGTDTYKIGDEVDFSVSFDEAVNVSGTPQLQLNVGGSTVYADYVDGDGSDILVFRYIVGAGNLDEDGITISDASIQLNGGTIQSVANAVAADRGFDTTGANSLLANVHIDGVAPAAPTTLALDADTGSSNSDKLTNDGKVTVSGLETGATWEYSTDGGTGWAAGSGSSFTLTGDGAKSVIVRQSDAAGNLSASSAPFTFTLDTTADDAPTMALNLDTGSSDSDGITSVGQVIVSGIESGSSWEFSVNGGASWTNGNGSGFTLLSDATYSLVVRQTDTAGNVSANSATYTVKLDTAAPGAPTINSKALTSDATPLLTGTAEDGGIVTVQIGGASYETISTGGHWSLDLGTTTPLAGVLNLNTNGANAVTVSLADKAGNVAAGQATQTLVIDTNAPSTPVLTLEADTGASGTDHITSNGKINISGLETGASWEYSKDGGASWSIGAGSSITFGTLYGPDLSVLIRQTDAAGNVSAHSNELSFTLDETDPELNGGITPSVATITDANIGSGGFSLSVTFSEAMDTSIDPTFSFLTPNEDPSHTITFESGVWSNGGKTFTASYSVSDSEKVLSNIDVTVIGAKDVAGNSFSSVTKTNVFSIVTVEAPLVSAISSTNADGVYKIGDTVDITIDFDTPVTLTENGGALQATLSNGKIITLSTLDGNSFAGTYTIAAGDGDVGELNVTGIELTGGATLASTVDGIPADLTTLPAGQNLADNKDIGVDATRPDTPYMGLTDSGASDLITNNGTVTVSRLEGGGSWEYTTDGTTWVAGTPGSNSFTLAEGDYALHDIQVRQTDAAGNVSLIAQGPALTIDTTAPTVTDIAAASADGTYKAGDTISLSISFSEMVNVTGTPTLQLETGTIDRLATYSGGSGTSTLTFDYVVQEGDSTADLDYLSTTALGVNGGSITDIATNIATLTLPSPGAAGSLGANKAIIVDGIAPTITGVSASTADGAYKEGATISIQVTFSENVLVAGGIPQLLLETGSTDRAALYTGGSGTDTLTFTYVVQAGDSAADLDYLSTAAFVPAGSTITDLAGNGASLTLAAPSSTGSLGAAKDIQVDTSAPTLDGAIIASVATITDAQVGAAGFTLSVSFSEEMDTTVSPVFSFPTLGEDPADTISLTGGTWSNGNKTFTATYSVSDADIVRRDIDVRVSGAQDGAGNSLAGTTRNDIFSIVTAQPPVVQSISSTDASGNFGIGSSINISVTFGEDVSFTANGGALQATLSNGRMITLAADGARGFSGTYIVAAGDAGSADLNVASLALTGSASIVADDDGLPASLGLPASNNLADNKNITVDTTIPTVTGLSSSTADGTYAEGATISIDVLFSEAVFVTGSPTLALDTGGTDRLATYAGGSGTGTLTFTYIVQAGDNSADLDVLSSGALNVAGGSITDIAANNAALSLPAPGASGSLGAAGNIIIDTTAPIITGVTIPDAGAGIGDSITVTINAGEAGLSLVSGTVNGRSVTGFADKGGGLYEATYTVTAGDTDRAAGDDIPVSFVLRDAVGNQSTAYVSAISQANDLIDATAPDSAIITSAASTGNATPTISGTAEAGSSVTLSIGGATYSTIATGGAWSVDLATAIPASGTLSLDLNGDNAVSVSVTDSAGNMAATQATQTLSIDTTAPSAPSIALTVDSGASAADGVTSNGEVLVSGLETGASWDYSTDGGSSWTAGSGSGFTIASDGTWSVLVRQADTLGNVSATSPALNVTLDNAAPTLGSISPSVARISDVQVGTDSFTLSVNFSEVMDTAFTPTISFPVADEDPSDTISFTSGVWSNGGRTYVATYSVTDQNVVRPDIDVRVDGARDTAGNSFVAVTQNDVFSILTSSPPAVQSITSSNANGDYGIDGRINISVTFSEMVSLNANGGALTAILSNGHTITLAADGFNSFSGTYVVTQGDRDSADLNVSALNLTGGAALVSTGNGLGADLGLPAGANLADNRNIRIDATVPDAPELSFTDTGASDGITNNRTISVSGLENEASWEYSTNGGTSWSSGSGGSFTLDGNTYAADSIQVRQTDAGGNESAVGRLGSAITIDSTAPVAQGLVLADADRSGSFSAGDVLTISFSEAVDISALSINSLTINGGSLGSGASLTPANASGGFATQFTITLGSSPTIVQGSTIAVADVRDAAGNPAAGVSFTLPSPGVGSPFPPPPALVVPITSTSLEDGVLVGRGVGIDPLTGREMEQLVLAPITGDGSGTDQPNAEIRLGGDAGAPVLLASVPVGYGLQVNGATHLTLGELAGATGDEAGRIAANGDVPTGSLAGLGLSALMSADTPVVLRTITPTVADGITTPPDQPLVIAAPRPADSSGSVTAVVIDGRSLPPGTHIVLEGIDFAIITGDLVITGGTGSNVLIADAGNQFINLGPNDDTLVAGAGDDTVGSGDGDDLLVGGAGNDSVFGGAGHDRLDGGSGNDTLTGGDGTDIARFHASLADISITRLENGDYLVTDHQGDQGSSLLSGVELLRLDDRVILLDQPDIFTIANPAGTFDEAAYLALNPDVAAAVAAGLLSSGLDHFQLYGAAEKRQADANHAYDGGLFSEAFYLASNPDVAAAVATGGFASGYEHWARWGQTEGRAGFAPIKFDLSLFDEAFYLKQNPDVAAAVTAGLFSSGLDHFARYGMVEGRDSSALFDAGWYLAHNPDVAAAVAGGLLSGALEHYSRYGWQEGRDPSAWFDTSDYLADHPDVAAAGKNPLAHLLEFGQAEGRTITAADAGLWL